MDFNRKVVLLRQQLSRLRLHQKVYGEDNRLEIQSAEEQLQDVVERRSEYWRTAKVNDFSDWQGAV